MGKIQAIKQAIRQAIFSTFYGVEYLAGSFLAGAVVASIILLLI